jgi:hypothetical protein
VRSAGGARFDRCRWGPSSWAGGYNTKINHHVCLKIIKLLSSPGIRATHDWLGRRASRPRSSFTATIIASSYIVRRCHRCRRRLLRLCHNHRLRCPSCRRHRRRCRRIPLRHRPSCRRRRFWLVVVLTPPTTLHRRKQRQRRRRQRAPAGAGMSPNRPPLHPPTRHTGRRIPLRHRPPRRRRRFWLVVVLTPPTTLHRRKGRQRRRRQRAPAGAGMSPNRPPPRPPMRHTATPTRPLCFRLVGRHRGVSARPLEQGAPSH